ncbi:hypothetical protein LTR95_011056 [Oleoguttula sp. CCFEE 5521]
MVRTGAAFPCTLTIHTPFPTERLAQIALRSLSVDEELSPLVQRSFFLVDGSATSRGTCSSDSQSVLKTEYRATTNRMLRVAVNGFFESLIVIIQVMEELDVDVIQEKGIESLEGAQGLEQGLTSVTAGGA